MRRLVPLLFAISGCSHDVEREASAGAATTVQIPLRGAPHAGSIREVAVTESGDGAVSIDDQGGVRVWLALDGSREPVPVVAPAPVGAAIADHGDEFVVGLLDEAGSAHLVRIGRDARLRGRGQLAGDVRIVQIASLGDGLLVRRADESIERIDASGAVRGRLVAEPGQRIASVVVRAGAAIAVIEGADGTSNSVRWIERNFTWGARLTLPAAVWPESVALSPSHTRLAGAEAKSRQLFVFDLSVKPAVVLGTSVQVAPGDPTGFVDDDHVATLGSAPRWWTSLAQPNVDPWAPTTPASPPAVTSSGAVANGFAVAGTGAALALIAPARVRYLGWNDIGVQTENVLDDRIAVGLSSTHIAWLDRGLALAHEATIPGAPATTLPIDDRHAVIEVQRGSDLHVVMIDVDHPEHEIALGVFPAIDRLEYESHSRVFGVGAGTVEHRYALDPARGTVKRLADLAVHTDASFFRLLDPELTDRAVAMEVVSDPNSRITTFLEVGGELRSAHARVVPGYVLAIDDRGHAYSRDGANTLFRDGEIVAKTIADAPVPAHAGGSFATFGADGVTMYDANGTQRWRQPIWAASSATFTTDDTRLVVRGQGGLVVLDAASGTRVATACGWAFGLHDTAPTGTAMGQGSVCEDSE